MRPASQLWQAGRSTIADEETRWLYDPAAVVNHAQKALSSALKKYGLSRKHKRDTETWRILATTFATDYAGDPRNLLAAHDYDAQKVYATLSSGPLKRMFPFLSGRKILPLWLRMYADT
jgi:hypothetical protein